MWQWTKACLPTASEELRLPLSAMLVVHFRNEYPQCWYSLQTTAALANFLTVTLEETLSQKHPASMKWISDAQKLYENINVYYYLMLLTFGQLICTAINILYSEICRALGFYKRRDHTQIGGSKKNLQSMWK